MTQLQALQIRWNSLADREKYGLYLTGAAYRGVGLASCVANAKRLAQDVAHDVCQPPAGVRPLTEVTS